MTTITDEMKMDAALRWCNYERSGGCNEACGTCIYRAGQILQAAISAALPDAGEGAGQVNALVDRFLAWSLPKSVCSDTCVTDRNYPFKRSGTNLLTAGEARQMIEYLLAPAGVATLAKAREAVGSNANPQGPSFHWRNGWMFARGEANYVHVWNIERGIDLAIPPNEWGSIIKALGGDPAPDRNAAIEECAKVISDYPGGGSQQVDIIKAAIIKQVRALKSPSTEGPPDGSIKGPKPLTMGLKLGGE